LAIPRCCSRGWTRRSTIEPAGQASATATVVAAPKGEARAANTLPVTLPAEAEAFMATLVKNG
jgi:hypothetical protein